MISFSPPGGTPFDLRGTPLLPVHMMVGTGYGLEPDWRHGKYHGPELVVQGVALDLVNPDDAERMWGMVDAVGRFEYREPAGTPGTACSSTGHSATTRRSGSRPGPARGV